jgi:hypothetical protein
MSASSEKIFIRRDLNGHVDTARRRFEKVHEGFGYNEHNQKGDKS